MEWAGPHDSGGGDGRCWESLIGQAGGGVRATVGAGLVEAERCPQAAGGRRGRPE